ncbi:hypothetical protein [Rheinheimera faecalis]
MKTYWTSWLKVTGLTKILINQLICKVTNWWIKPDFTAAVATISLALFLAPMLAFGPWLQQLIFGVLQSDATTIYNSVYGNAIVKFPSLSDFLLIGFELPYWAMSLLISAVALQSNNLRVILTRFIVVSFLILFCWDLIIAVQTDEFSTHFIIENLIADFIGSILLGLIYTAVIVGAEFVFNYAHGTVNARTSFATVYVLLSALIVPIFLYYACRLILNPTPVNVEITLGKPASGFYGKSDTQSTDASYSGSILPLVSDSADAHWYTEGGNGLKLNWESQAKDVIFDAELSVKSSCSMSEHTEEVFGAGHKNLQGLKKLELWIDGGGTTLNLNADRQAVGTFSLQMDNSMFWIDQESDHESMKITHFTDEKAELEFTPSDKVFTSSILIPLIKNHNNIINLEPRSIKITVEDKLETATFLPDECKKNSDITSSNADMLVPEVTIAVKISKRETHSNLNSLQPLRFTAKGGKGWLSVSNISAKQLERTNINPLSAILIQTPVESIRVDGIERDSGKLDAIAVLGAELKGAFRQGNLILIGEVKYLWSGPNRWSPTRWERLDWTIKALLISMLSLLLGPYAQFLFKRLNNNDPIHWLYKNIIS